MPRRRITSLAVGAGIALFLAWMFLAPTQLGGPIVYSTIDGISMQPLLHRGELVLVRPEPAYRVGDVVLYGSPTLHRSVMHRIVAVRGGHYFFKGDNNDFVDPGFATRSDLLGRLWLTVPYAGGTLDWLRSPLHSALLAAGAALLLFSLGVTATGAGRRRRRRGSAPAPAAPPVPRAGRPRELHARPLTVVALGLLLFGAILAVVAFRTAPQRSIARDSYTQLGTFSYLARAEHPSSAYPTGVATTGQPVFFNQFRSVNLHFRYRLAGAAATGVRGTIVLRALLWSDSGWHSLATLAPRHAFTGASATVSGAFQLGTLQTLIEQLGRDSGAVGGTYQIELSPVVHVSGTIGGKPFRDSFEPTLPISATAALLKIDLAAASPATPIGGNYASQSEDQILSAALHPRKTGTTGTVVTNQVRGLSVALLRWLAWGLLLAGSAVLAVDVVRHRREVWPDDVRLAHRHDVTLIDIADLAPGVEEAATRMPNLAELASLARLRQEPIFRLRLERGAALYVLEDVGRTYVCRFDPSVQPQPVPSHGLHLQLPVRLSQPRRAPWLLRSAIAGAVLLAILTATVAFTAGNTVPASYVGTFSQARQIAQLEPAQCAGMTLTNLVIGAGSTVTGTAANDLILGLTRAGTVSFNGAGGNDCIVAGGNSGTTNSISGGSGTDVCIGGPQAKKNTFTACETTY